MSRRAPSELIPQLPEEMTAEWFTSALAPSSADGTVTAVRTEAVGTDIGFAGDVHRAHLTWDEAGPGRPDSVIVKVPATNPTNRASAEAVGAYEREILVYRDLADEMGLPMPRMLHAAMTPNPAAWMEPALIWLFDHLPMWLLAWLTRVALWLAGHSRRRYVLVLEDIADAHPPRQRDGGTTEDVRDALALMARFHAAHWMDEALADAQPWILPLDTTPRLMQAAYVGNRSDFVARMGDAVDTSTMRRLDAIQDDLPTILHRLASPPWTLLHGDFRLDNVLVRPDRQMVVLDFQLPRFGRAASDVAYFVTTALDPSERAAEDELLSLYHEALVAEGVDDYPFDTFVEDIRLATLVLGQALVATGELLDTAFSDGDSNFADEISERALGWLAEAADGSSGAAVAQGE